MLIGHRHRQGLPTDYFLGFLFEELLNENAAKQIKQCAPALRELFAASPDKRRTQWTILEGVVNLVTSPMHPSWLLKKTPVILMALCAPPPPRPDRPRPGVSFCTRCVPTRAGTTSAFWKRMWSSSGRASAVKSTRRTGRFATRPRRSSSGSAAEKSDPALRPRSHLMNGAAASRTSFWVP